MTEREVILTTVTDRSQLELLSKQMGKEGYEVVSAASVPELITALRKKGKIAMAVIDMSAFDETIWQHLDGLRESKTPFIVISPERSPSIQRDSLKHGASGLFTKGLRFKELVEYIHTLLGK
jgi:DNA-binding NtrC family response regulator